MNVVTKNAAVALCAVSATMGASWRSAADAQTSQPVQVMTDTPEYCDTLRQRIDQMPPAAPEPVLTEVRSLETEGRRLCDAGETRGGILRLRHALMLMMHASRDPDQEP